MTGLLKAADAMTDNGFVKTRAVLLASALLALSAAPAAGQGPLGDPLVPFRGQYLTLSNEKTLTRWAFTNLAVKVRRAPSPRARTLGKLRFNTEHGREEIYLALRAYTDPRGKEWVQIRWMGKRHNNRKGWVPREGLGEYHVVRTQLVVDRRRLTATLYRKGKRIFRTRVGVGKGSTPTPGGHFWIREVLSGYNNPTYGPFAFGTSAYSTKLENWPGGPVVGIHGTNQPHLIPGRPSHGCIRIRNGSIRKLKRLMPRGTPLRIL